MNKKPKFYRSAWNKIKKFRTKKKLKWRRAYGGDNQRRLKKKGYAAIPRIGYGNPKKDKGKIKGMDFVRVENLKDLEKVKTKGIVIGNIGKKKRLEIIKKAGEMKLEILNKYKEETNAIG